MFEGAVGVGVVVLFLRMARLDEENQFLWSLLAAVAWFVPAYLMGPVAPYGCTGLLFGAYRHAPPTTTLPAAAPRGPPSGRDG